MPIVTATGMVSGKSGRKGANGRAIEQAMKAAIEQAHAEGIQDPDEIRARMLAARDAVKAERGL